MALFMINSLLYVGITMETLYSASKSVNEFVILESIFELIVIFWLGIIFDFGSIELLFISLPSFNPCKL